MRGRAQTESRPLSRFDPRPQPEDTPYRSRLYVAGKVSVDGNDYRPGDPIPAAEAVRQGLVTPQEAQDTQIPVREPCGRCGGHGEYALNKPPGHRTGCACKFCGPCHVCGGKGYQEVADGKAEEAAAGQAEAVRDDRGDQGHPADPTP